MPPHILGYIVQSLDENIIMPPIQARHMFLHFSEALQHAKEVYSSYMEEHTDEDAGPFELYSPTKQHVDFAGGGLVFRSRDLHVWIDCITQ